MMDTIVSFPFHYFFSSLAKFLQANINVPSALIMMALIVTFFDYFFGSLATFLQGYINDTSTLIMMGIIVTFIFH